MQIDNTFIADIGYIVGVVVVLAAGVTTIFVTKKDRTGSDCQNAIVALRAQNELQAGQIADNQKDIAKLEGIVSVTKDIPLRKIEEHMAAQLEQSDKTNQILERLANNSIGSGKGGSA